eukprot:TRINITY_DN110116_c0_g1_i1.p1 TRINITY_DN110116_c0_g1~~TRINITY_DN110116_c0_g1_i1.p1  ORF type:complete len:396 (-),score=33.23 TRINITY_DN110116_c0_g1_i1:301-1467(-)
MCSYLRDVGFALLDCFHGCQKLSGPARAGRIHLVKETSSEPTSEHLQALIRAQLLGAWTKEALSERNFKLELHRPDGQRCQLSVAVRGAKDLNALVGAVIRMQSWYSNGIRKCRFVIPGALDNTHLAIFGREPMHYIASDSTLRLEVKGYEDSYDVLNALQGSTIVSAFQLATRLPEEVTAEASRIAIAKSLELSWQGDGNERPCHLRDITGNTIQHTSAFRLALYEDSSIDAAAVPEDNSWVCGICLCEAENDTTVEYCKLKCGHSFHRTCIQSWFQRCRGGGNHCPLGRCFVAAEAIDSSRPAMCFSLSTRSAWAQLPEDVVVRDEMLDSQTLVWTRRAAVKHSKGLPPHLRNTTRTTRFRDKDFNPGIYVAGMLHAVRRPHTPHP